MKSTLGRGKSEKKKKTEEGNVSRNCLGTVKNHVTTAEFAWGRMA